MFEDSYQPVTEIVIHIGEKGEAIDLNKLRVYINGEKIENLRGFKFSAGLNEPPEITIKKLIYNQENSGLNVRHNRISPQVQKHNL